MKRFTKKSLAVLLAVVLVLSLSVSALAAWPSFQKDQVNNGTITTGTPPTSTPSVTTLGLPYGEAEFAGVSAPSVINNGTVYTLYNGGLVTNPNGGARVQASDLATGATLWNVQVDADANNVQQLSTPYLDTANNILYAATTHYRNRLASTGTAGWSGTGVTPPNFTFPVGITTINYGGLVVPSDYWEPQFVTDIEIMSSGLSGNVVLTPTGSGTPFEFSTQSYFPGFGSWTLFNFSGAMLEAGTYDVEFTINNTTGSPITATSLQFLTSEWALKSVNTTGTPTVNTLKTGYGQANTPIYRADGSGYLYFGIFEGDRSYNQYQINNGAMITFKPGDDFYWAGAVAVTLNNVQHVAFGGDNGIIYARPVGTDFGSGTGYTVDLSATEPDVGNIRSTIVFDGTNGYLTSVGAAVGGPGFLWRVTTAGVATRIPLAGNSVSTPVLSENNYIYVGWYDFSVFPAEGGVQAVYKPTFATTTPIYEGDPVQSSAIVYTEDEYDYIYFTTNSSSGKGFCYSFDTLFEEVDEVWFSGGTSNNPFAVQGFASDGEYIVYGDDGNYLYIMK